MKIDEVTVAPTDQYILDIDKSTWLLQQLIRDSRGKVTRTELEKIQRQMQYNEHSMLIACLISSNSKTISWINNRIKWCKSAIENLQVIDVSESFKHSSKSSEQSVAIFEQLMNEFSEMQRKHYG
jgi:Ca2+-binding EF-hand superfamily protein